MFINFSIYSYSAESNVCSCSCSFEIIISQFSSWFMQQLWWWFVVGMYDFIRYKYISKWITRINMIPKRAKIDFEFDVFHGVLFSTWVHLFTIQLFWAKNNAAVHFRAFRTFLNIFDYFLVGSLVDIYIFWWVFFKRIQCFLNLVSSWFENR